MLNLDPQSVNRFKVFAQEQLAKGQFLEKKPLGKVLNEE